MASKQFKGEHLEDINGNGIIGETGITVDETLHHRDFNGDGDQLDVAVVVDEDRRSTVTDKSWFDLGTAEMMSLCTSCHMGGGPFEGIVQEGGSVLAYDSGLVSEEGGFDRDFYSYDGKATTNAYYGADTILGAVALSGDPAPSDWNATGVMEADCLMCHIDPDHTGRLVAADGVKIDPNRPRMMIFSERDGAGDVTKVSLGMPLANALANEVVRPYTDGLNRMSRPTPKNAMAEDFSAAQVGMMMQTITTGLNDIEAGDDSMSVGFTFAGNSVPYGPMPGTPLPYALYGDPSLSATTWTPSTAAYAMGGMVINDSYCPNPLGVEDEMTRFGAHYNDLMALFQFMADGFTSPTPGVPGSGDVPTLMSYMFNDFIYAFQIKMATGASDADPIAWGGMYPIPVQLHSFENGKFYSDADDFQASVRDYVRNPLVENSQGKSLTGGILYSGRVGLANAAMEFGMGLNMCKDATYTNQPNGFPDTAGIVQHWQDGATYTAVGVIQETFPGSGVDETQPEADARVAACTPPGSPMTLGQMAAYTGNPGGMKNLFGGAVHDELPSFFDAMPTAELMGLDLNQNGAPMTYVQLIKDVIYELIVDINGVLPTDMNPAYEPTYGIVSQDHCDGQTVNAGWCAKTYYEYDELISSHDNLHSNMFGGVKDANSQKWTKVCGQCHIMLKDHDNSNVEMVRKYNLGMSADFVKNGHFVNMTSDPEAEGYDVHMSEGMLGCGSCHLIQADYHGDKDPNTDLEAMHNFLKGTDTAHMVRNDLDNNIRPKNCEQCHIEDIDENNDSATVMAAHEARFGDHTAVHMEKISCQACHIPYKKTWRFRAFDDTLGYYGNFDNRMGYDVLPTAKVYTQAEADVVTEGTANDPVTDAMVGTAVPPTMDLMAFPAQYGISPVYGASPGYGIPHFNMVAQAVNADGTGQRPMDYVSEMVDYFHMTKDGDPGQIVNYMPTNPKFDFWKYFFQMFWNMKSGAMDGTAWTLDAEQTFATGTNVPDNRTYPPLYYANGTNGFPQIVTGNPITIMTWVDVNAGDVDNDGFNDMANISYGGAKIVYLREIMATISEYYPPTNLGAMMAITPTEWAGGTGGILPNDPAYASHPGLGKVILKPTPNNLNGYILYDHTGDMYPEMWSDEDVAAVKEALTIALNFERDPTLVDATAALNMANGADPRPFIAAHYFSDTHGVKPAGKALGATSCYDCHGDSTTADVGAMRTTDRLLNFLPWKPLWYTEANFVAGNFIIDHEVAYLTPVDDVDGVDCNGDDLN